MLNYSFMHNVSQMVTRIASLGLNDKPGDVFLAKIKPKNSRKTKSNHLPLDQMPNQIQDLNKDQAEITLKVCDKYLNIFYVVWSIHVYARQIKALNILRNYQTTLQNTISALKAVHLTTKVKAETSIHLAKSALRAICLADNSNWADSLPLIVNSLNQMFLYQISSRNSLFYNPLVFQNHLNLNGLIFPEHLFE